MIRFDLPPALEAELRREWGADLDEAAKAAFLGESYRTARLSLGELTQILGLTTQFETERWLAARGLARNYDLDDVTQDRRVVDDLLRE